MGHYEEVVDGEKVRAKAEISADLSARLSELSRSTSALGKNIRELSLLLSGSSQNTYLVDDYKNSIDCVETARGFINGALTAVGSLEETKKVWVEDENSYSKITKWSV